MDILKATLTDLLRGLRSWPSRDRGLLRGALLCLALLLMWGATPAQAQVFSPGELIRGHAALDSMTSCGECHTGQQKVDRNKCLSCHTLIDKSVKTRKGLHGQPETRAQNCVECHTDHKGRDASIITWPGGRKERFPHQKAGWPLKGAHANEECSSCHDVARIVSPLVKEFLQKQKKRSTFLGLETDCTDCHFDEHRGKLEGTCESCHVEKAWKPAPGFDHTKAWKLDGAHTKVDCKKCHESVKDPAFQPNVFPKPRANAFFTFSPVKHEQCTDCHTDPHKSRFGNNCTKCHTTQSWAVNDNNRAMQDVSFHDKTSYPLRGLHQAVDCDTCHPKDKSGMKLLKPIPHDKCAQCHPTAHPEVTAEGAGKGRSQECESCHTLDGFQLISFAIEDHEKTRFPLVDAHQVASCTECHQDKLGKARESIKPEPVRNFLAKRVLSSWLLEAHNMPLDSCQSCHATPHRDQFPNRQCTECHSQTTWKNATTFDHSKTKYRLEGNHKDVACALCHVQETDSAGTMVRYTPVNTEDCTPCHGDVHYGQFQKLSPKLDCKQCHQVSGFKEVLFKHNQPTFSDFPLEGKHETVDCQKCHPTLQLTSDIKAQRFRPTPEACAVCHVDPHKGAYRAAAKLVRTSAVSPMIQPVTPAASDTPTSLAVVAAWTAPSRGPTWDSAEITECEVCHETRGWSTIRFDHSATGFALKGQHKGTPCQSCHVPGNQAKLPTDCASCHTNIHQGELGYTCQECHTEDSFKRTILPVNRHARSSFPLLGKHAVTGCRECHADVRGVSFEQTPTDCFACHERALQSVAAAAIDHSSFPTACGQCHSPLSWRAANYQGHNRCFPITPGTNHWGISCASCHPGATPAVSGTCSDTGISCVNCHGCEEGEHQGVRGYECADQKCYQCHPGGTE